MVAAPPGDNLGTTSIGKNMEQPKNRPASPIARSRHASRRRRNRRLIGVERVAHQIANQVTVINLTCFKLRVAIKTPPASVEADIERLEHAVAEMNNLVEILNRLKEQSAAAYPERKNSSSSGGTSNVYSLAELKKATP